MGGGASGQARPRVLMTSQPDRCDSGTKLSVRVGWHESQDLLKLPVRFVVASDPLKGVSEAEMSFDEVGLGGGCSRERLNRLLIASVQRQ